MNKKEDEKVMVSVAMCHRQTEKAYLLKMEGMNLDTNTPVELESWWPKSQVNYDGSGDLLVPKWLLSKKIEEKFGDVPVEIW